jgi:ADP-heptose:LPS heptosyltransferase
LKIEPRKILIIRLRAIGDVLLCTPIVRALRKKFPQAQIDFLTEKQPAEILKNNSYLSKIYVLPKHESVLSYCFVLKNIIENHYNWVLDFFGNPRSAWITWLTFSKLRMGYAHRFRKWAYTHPIPLNRIRRYQVEVNLKFLEFLKIPFDNFQLDFFLTSEEYSWGKKTIDQLNFGKFKIALNPTGSWPAKCWPLEYWEKLIFEINSHFKTRPILLWGPDTNWAIEFQKKMEDRLIIAPRTDLRQLASLIAQVQLLVGNDGAPQHIAQALGTRSLTIFGPTWGVSWTKPVDSRHQYLQEFLDCGPCDQTQCHFPTSVEQGEHSYQECLTRITPRRVLMAMEKMLNNSV